MKLQFNKVIEQLLCEHQITFDVNSDPIILTKTKMLNNNCEVNLEYRYFIKQKMLNRRIKNIYRCGDLGYIIAEKEKESQGVTSPKDVVCNFLQDIDGYDHGYRILHIGVSIQNEKQEIKFVEDGRLCELKSGQKQKAQEIVKTTLQNIAKQCNKKYDFGLDSELIYLNILVNTNAKLHSKLLLDQLKFFEDKKSTFNEYFIKPEFQDLKGHVFLKIFDLKVIKMGKLGVSQIGKSNELFVDSQTSFVGSIEKQLNQGYNFQTQIGGGCCGYFASCYAIEILNNIEKYQPLLEIQNVNRITKKQQCLLSQLHLNTMQKVSELIDGQSVIKTQKDQEGDFKIKLDDGITYYIDSGCDRSNCINIEGLFCYLIQKQGYNFGNNRCIEKQINTQNQKALCGKNHNIGISKRVCGMQKLFVERLEYTRSKSAPARFERW